MGDVPDPLLDAKLHVPRLRHRMVARPRLDERVAHGTRSSVTVISAPAGFGKTTLIAEWLAADDDRPSAAWVSLDAGDNDAVAFWSYVLAALDAASSGACAGARSMLETPGYRIEGVLTRALNELSDVPFDIVLEIEAAEIHGGVSFLLDHLPPRLHVLMTARSDPPLRLARLRARGELVEIRAADLRFTPDEAAAFLAGPMGLAVSTEDVHALERRTEGWIAALQLAALSMQGRDDPGSFIAGFAGDDRYVVDYLVEEVLLRQPEHVRRFLLETSILERLTGSLCDAVTGRGDSRAMLDGLDRDNLFLIPLDERRRWYRYHHLFADMLRTRLSDERPDQVPDLHRRAGEWFARQGDLSDGIRHALAGGDSAWAADLIEAAVPEMRRSRQDVTLRRWLEGLPRAVLEARPVLGLTYAGALMQSGQLAGVEEVLRSAERWVEEQADATVDADGADHSRVPVEIAMYRAAQALMSGDPAGTATHAQRALDLSDARDELGRGAAATLLGLAHWTIGDLESAERWYAEGMVSLERAGFISDLLGCSVALADLQVAQGRLEDARRTYERGLAIATRPDGAPLRGAADMHTGLGELARERGDLAAASHHLSESRRLGDESALPQNAYRWRLLAARIRHAEGDLARAIDLITEAERWHTTDMSPDVRPLAAVRARLLVAQGDPDAAADWARRHDVAATDDITYLHEFQLGTLARLLVVRGSRDRADGPLDEAVSLTGRLLAAAQAGRRDGGVLDILVVRALAFHARGDIPHAVADLTRALELAGRHGHVRTFLDEGPRMVALLRLAPKQGAAGSYAHRLLTASVDSAASGPQRQPLIEPLSERELDVLRLLAGDLDGPGIADELTVSLSTVRSHTKSIYAKLGVNDRRAAVRRAGELGLLTGRRERHTAS
jgi:LuxR family transcriptional regulator, maltose regulon positive regulatory protein